MVALTAIAAAFSVGEKLIDKFFPDPADKAREMLKLAELEQKGNLAELQGHIQLMMGQIEINKIDAKSGSFFQAGWRPAVGWMGCFSLGYAGLIYPLMIWLWTTAQALGKIPADLAPPPLIEVGVLGTIITGMLGIGTMRSVDKKNGVNS